MPISRILRMNLPPKMPLPDKKRKMMKKWPLLPITCLMRKKISRTWVNWPSPRKISIQPSLHSKKKERKRTKNSLTSMAILNPIRNKWLLTMTSRKTRSKKKLPDRRNQQSLISTSSMTRFSQKKMIWAWEARERSGRTTLSITLQEMEVSWLEMKMRKKATLNTINLPKNRNMKFSSSCMLSTKKILTTSPKIRENSLREN